MNFGALPVPVHLKRLVALILIAGFGAAILIYVDATMRPANTTGYQFEESKRYQREMELYGGKANLLASEFRVWFASLWHGRNLAFTVAFLTVVIAFAVLFFAIPLPPSDGNGAAPT